MGDEIGKEFIGMPCKEFHALGIEQSKLQAQSTMMDKRFSVVIRAKCDDSQYAQESGPRIRYNIARSIPHDLKAENNELLRRLAIYADK